MKEVLDELIKYLENGYGNDTSLSKNPLGHYAYEFNLKPSTIPYFEVQELSNGDNDEDFNDVVNYNSDIQINIYGVKMAINDEVVTPQISAMLLADRCEKLMAEYKKTNNNIIRMRKIVRSFALPYEDGSKAYTIAIRYSITFKNK